MEVFNYEEQFIWKTSAFPPSTLGTHLGRHDITIDVLLLWQVRVVWPENKFIECWRKLSLLFFHEIRWGSSVGIKAKMDFKYNIYDSPLCTYKSSQTTLSKQWALYNVQQQLFSVTNYHYFFIFDSSEVGTEAGQNICNLINKPGVILALLRVYWEKEKNLLLLFNACHSCINIHDAMLVYASTVYYDFLKFREEWRMDAARVCVGGSLFC